jgi:hypothetical protein
MIMNSLAALYQWIFPKPFRIEVNKSTITMASILSEHQATLKKYQHQFENDLKGNGLDTGFVIQICNDYFRIRRNLEQLKQAETPQSPQVRRISNILNHIEWTFKDYKIECLDLTGQPIIHGRKDVEVIAKADNRPDLNLSQPTIIQCERPAIRMNGNLVQTARVTVAEP